MVIEVALIATSIGAVRAMGHGCLLDLLFHGGDIIASLFASSDDGPSNHYIFFLVAVVTAVISGILLAVNLLWHPQHEFFAFCLVGMPIFSLVSFLLAGWHWLCGS